MLSTMESGARIGFGAMHLHTGPGPRRERSAAVLRRAVELGVTA